MVVAMVHMTSESSLLVGLWLLGNFGIVHMSCSFALFFDLGRIMPDATWLPDPSAPPSGSTSASSSHQDQCNKLRAMFPHHSDANIMQALKECGFDPRLAAHRLLDSCQEGPLAQVSVVPALCLT